MTDPHDTPDLARQLVRIHGSDNEDGLRGIYLDGVVPDEYGGGESASRIRPPTLTNTCRAVAPRRGGPLRSRCGTISAYFFEKRWRETDEHCP